MQVGRIARAAAVFCVDEIIVFDDNPSGFAPNVVSDRYTRGKKSKSKQEILDSIPEGDQPWQNPDQFLYHVLAFAECPPHLRFCHDDPSLSIFQKHKNLEWAGTLPSMDMPHHLRPHEWCQFREGVVAGPADPPAAAKSSKKDSKKGESKLRCERQSDLPVQGHQETGHNSPRPNAQISRSQPVPLHYHVRNPATTGATPCAKRRLSALCSLNASSMVATTSPLARLSAALTCVTSFQKPQRTRQCKRLESSTICYLSLEALQG
jgi:hypothetical protein